MVKVIATDLDGTLLKPRKKITLVEKENRKFIKDFYGDIVLNSGRSPKFCAKICKNLKIEHNFIALNGAIIVKNGNVIYRQSIKKTVLDNLLDYINENYNNYQFLIYDKYDQITCFTDKKRKAKRNHLKFRIKNVRLSDKIIFSNKKVKRYLKDKTEIYKAIIYYQHIEDMACLLKDKFSEHFEFYVNNHSIEISPKGVSKGEALKYLINTTNVKSDEVYVVGDSFNDISMFKLFKNSFLIKTSDSGLKTQAKHVIDKFSDLINYTRLNKNFH